MSLPTASARVACFVIDSVARSLLKLKERGINLPLSFNLNGFDMLEPAVKNKLKLVANQLGENVNLLEIELTEAETSLHVDNIAAHRKHTALSQVVRLRHCC